MDPGPELFRAVQGGDLTRMRELLEAHPGVARAKKRDGLTVLQLAAYLRNPEVIRLLRSHDALTTVHEAAILGDVEALDRLLDADPEALDRPGPDGFPPLHLAAHFAQHDAVQRLLERGADLKARSTNASGNTALHAAAAGASVSTLRILLASGADPDARDADKNTPLHIAAAAGAVPCVEALIAGGAESSKRNGDGDRPEDVARGRGKKAVLAALGKEPVDAPV